MHDLVADPTFGNERLEISALNTKDPDCTPQDRKIIRMEVTIQVPLCFPFSYYQRRVLIGRINVTTERKASSFCSQRFEQTSNRLKELLPLFRMQRDSRGVNNHQVSFGGDVGAFQETSCSNLLSTARRRLRFCFFFFS